METPIYGVLMLDPSRYSPLELVKSGGADLVRGVGILLCGPGRNLNSNPGRIRSADLQCIQPGRTRAEMSAPRKRRRQECPRHTEMHAPQMKE